MEVSHSLFEINTEFKSIILRRRKEFMELVLKCLNDDEPNTLNVNELFQRFGTRLVTTYNKGSKVAIMLDGDLIFKR
jgi:hypothetical protein